MVTFKYCAENDIEYLFKEVRSDFYIDFGLKFNTVESFRKYITEAQIGKFHDFFLVYDNNRLCGCVFSERYNSDARCMTLKIFLGQRFKNMRFDVLRLCERFFSAKYSLRKIFLFSCENYECDFCHKIAVFAESHYINLSLVDSFCYEVNIKYE